MDDVVFLSHYTSSGLNEIFEMDIDLYYEALESAMKFYELENKTSE